MNKKDVNPLSVCVCGCGMVMEVAKVSYCCSFIPGLQFSKAFQFRGRDFLLCGTDPHIIENKTKKS